MALQFEIDTLYTQAIPGNTIPKAAFREALRLEMPPAVASILNTVSEMKDWQLWMKEGKASYTGVWTKRFAKVCYENIPADTNGHKLDPELLAKIGETLKRFTLNGEYHFEITRFMDWKPGDFAEKSNSCWWSSFNKSRKGFNQLDNGYAVLFYESPEKYKLYKNKKGIGRCWLLNAPKYGAIFNAYGVPLSDIATILSKKFEVDMLKTELYSQGAYLNQGNKNNEEGHGGDTGLGFILGHNLEKLPVPIDMGNFQYKPTCGLCGKKTREVYEGRDFRHSDGRHESLDLCDSCMHLMTGCRVCGVCMHKPTAKHIYDGDRGTVGDYCPECIAHKVISVCEVHGEHIGRSYKVWHKKARYCHKCLQEATAVCKCNKCNNISNDFKSITIGSYRFKLCKHCKNGLLQELE